MRDLYSDDYESVAGGGADRLIPDGVRRLSGAAVFLALDRRPRPLVLPARHPRRQRGADHQGDGGAGPGRAGEPRRRAGGAPGARGQQRARRAAGAAAARRRRPPGRSRRLLQAEDAPQGELVLAAPAILAGRVLGEDGDLPMPPQEDTRARDARRSALGRGRRGGGRPAAAQPAGESRRRARPKQAAPRRRSRRRQGRRGEGRGAQARGDQGRLGGAGGARPRACGRGRAWCSSAPSTARRSPGRPGRSWWPRTATCWRRRASSSSGPPPTPGCSTGCGWRGSPSADQTRQMCEALRARGVACIPVTLQ